MWGLLLIYQKGLLVIMLVPRDQLLADAHGYWFIKSHFKLGWMLEIAKNI